MPFQSCTAGQWLASLVKVKLPEGKAFVEGRVLVEQKTKKNQYKTKLF